MNINGVNTLACLCRISKETNKDVKIYPLPHSASRRLVFVALVTDVAQCMSSRTSLST
jgi:succinate dehydrogenase/fumarate reductase-like Fe-S protein